LKSDFYETIVLFSYTNGQKVKPRIERKYNLECSDLRNSFFINWNRKN